MTFILKASYHSNYFPFTDDEIAYSYGERRSEIVNAPNNTFLKKTKIIKSKAKDSSKKTDIWDVSEV